MSRRWKARRIKTESRIKPNSFRGRPNRCDKLRQTKSLAESSVSVLIIGVLGSLLLAVGGLLIGVGFAQFLVPTFPGVFIVPLALNIGIAYVLIRGKRADA